jgi:nucleotide-binding universal stress UspA family protein
MKGAGPTLAKRRDVNTRLKVGLGKRAMARPRASPAMVPQLIELRRILVPVDFSQAAAKPLQYSASMATAHGAKVILLHVTKPVSYCVDCGYGPVNRRVPDEAQVKKARWHLRRLAAKYLPPATRDEILIRSGEASEQIICAASELKADLIVLCAHEASAANLFGFHETADRVMRQAPCPVFVVRSREHDFIRPPRRPD